MVVRKSSICNGRSLRVEFERGNFPRRSIICILYIQRYVSLSTLIGKLIRFKLIEYEISRKVSISKLAKIIESGVFRWNCQPGANYAMF